MIGRRSQHMRRPGLGASSDGVLATKSERRMLASTSLYSLYAWFVLFLFRFVPCFNTTRLSSQHVYGVQRRQSATVAVTSKLH